jgi:hypothetical protein
MLGGLTMLVAGCTTDYRVTGPSGKEYYTTEVGRKGAAVKFKDAKTQSLVTLQSSEVKEISGVDTATAMQIVGHKSDKMWKRYNAIEESDLLNAARKLNAYLETNTPITPASSAKVTYSITA